MIVMKAMTDLMFELESVLKEHAQRYPLMEPVDAVKLIYQNEFGGGHLICDEEKCLNYLRLEYSGVKKDPNTPRYECIGNGVVRVNLAAVSEAELDQLGREFIRSAAEHTGSMDRFLQKLEVLCQSTRKGLLPFGLEELENYLLQYKDAGCPMVSHSEIYRQNYHPAYRVVLSRHKEHRV